jgi:integrative and conjugative element protein (TIGR02256 family)
MSGLHEVDALFFNPLHSGSKVLIEGDVLSGIHAHRQLSPTDCEAGGILLGYRRWPHLHIVEFTAPAAGDQRSRYEFFRCDPFHANRAHERWKATSGRLDLLGEWHTHPEQAPSPSSLDLSEWRRILRRADTARVFVIVGLVRDWIAVGLGSRIQTLRTA